MGKGQHYTDGGRLFTTILIIITLTTKVDIRVLLVEFSHIDKKKLLDMMDRAGYDNPFNLQEDLVFVKRQP